MKYIDKEYNIEYLNEIIKSESQGIILESETFYHNQINDVIKAAEGKRIILLSGPSASGKTTTANKICDQMNKNGLQSVVVSLDHFYHNRKSLPIINGKPNAEVIEALSVTLIHKAMDDLLKTGKTLLPEYDFITGNRTDEITPVSVGKNGVVIFEGIHALNPKIHKGLKEEDVFGLYVSPHSRFYDDKITLSRREMRFLRRLVRDSWARGTRPERTFEMWSTVCEGEDLFIRPFSTSADFHINTTHAYEPFIMKNKAINLLLAIEMKSEYYEKAQRYIQKLLKFSQIDIKCLPSDSLLREFIND